ncbi:2-haloacrylate reductase [Baekduia alba]|uniref:zinc-binding dehydrogenase n=1 Tax=Baekduia alba TaxID=2997333 RepID=UPI002340F841|nr:zinc-binding dehydrogenase [Baekduia alba]WCB91540.1 2-haloacrylate reductase [Baekduia alba]
MSVPKHDDAQSAARTRAVHVTRFGGPEVLRVADVPAPVAGAGQAVVAVAFADVLDLDTKVRGGWGAQFGLEPPFVPGTGVGGTVVGVGAGVDRGWVGRRVITGTGEHGGSDGYAERIVARVDQLVAVPEDVDLDVATALLHDGPTALALAENADIGAGDHVLVLGAAGGAGLLLVQLAHAAGARVIGAARGVRKLELVRRAGADVLIDYSEAGWGDGIREAVGDDGIQVVFDGVGGELGLTAFGLVARGGRFSAHGAASGRFAPIDVDAAARDGVVVRGIEQVQFDPEAGKRLSEQVLAAAAQQQIAPAIGQTFPLEDAARAHAAIEARACLGKTLLVV